MPTAPVTTDFVSMPTDFWAFKYVEYGYSRTRHRERLRERQLQPNDNVDRGQMSVFISRSVVTPTGDAGLPGYTPPTTPQASRTVPTGLWTFKYVEYLH